MGTFCSFLLVIVLIAFAGYKVYVLENKISVDIVEAVYKNHFDDHYKFGAEQGLNIAVAIVNASDQETYQPLDPLYGRLRVSKTKTGLNEQGIFGLLSEEEIGSHPCTLEEVGLAGSNPKFFPVTLQHKRTFEPAVQSFTCVDQSKLEVQGGINSALYQYISVEVIRCTGDVLCKSEEEVMKYFEKRQIYALMNSIRFDPQKFGKEAIVMESSIDRILLSQWQNVIRFQINKAKLSLQDL